MLSLPWLPLGIFFVLVYVVLKSMMRVGLLFVIGKGILQWENSQITKRVTGRSFFFCSIPNHGILKTSFDTKPKVKTFNNNVPQCTLDEGVIIEYALMPIEQGRQPIHVQNNYIPKRTTLGIEDLLSAFKTSLKINKCKRKFLYHCFYWHDMLCGFINYLCMQASLRRILPKKHPSLMGKFNLMKMTHNCVKRAEENTPFPTPPKVVFQNSLKNIFCNFL